MIIIEGGNAAGGVMLYQKKQMFSRLLKKLGTLVE